MATYKRVRARVLVGTADAETGAGEFIAGRVYCGRKYENGNWLLEHPDRRGLWAAFAAGEAVAVRGRRKGADTHED
jgi:hypothetical protein